MPFTKMVIGKEEMVICYYKMVIRYSIKVLCCISRNYILFLLFIVFLIISFAGENE